MTIKIDLAGSQGNAWALLGYARTWGKQLGWTEEQQKRVHEDMTKGDYHALLTAFENAFKDAVGFRFINDPRKEEQ